MKNKNLILSVIILVVILIIICISLFFLSNGSFPKTFSNIFSANQITGGKLSGSQIMQIIKTDQNYSGLSGFAKNFDPEVTSYIKLGPDEYKSIRADWQIKGFTDRITRVDHLGLTDSTYWIELKDKNNGNKGLLMVLDVQQKKSLLLIASLSISAGVSI